MASSKATTREPMQWTIEGFEADVVRQRSAQGPRPIGDSLGSHWWHPPTETFPLRQLNCQPLHTFWSSRRKGLLRPEIALSCRALGHW